MPKKEIIEVYLVRSIACLCVVLLHSITRVMEFDDLTITVYHENLLMGLRLLLTFGTPTFIFLSEFLLAYSYSEAVPNDFLKKRVKLILLPYFSMCFVYAILMTHETGGFQNHAIFTVFILNMLKNIFFGFYRHGYFIIVIFQFYFLHILLHKKLNNFSPKKVLLITLIINMLYLAFFNFVNPTIVPYGETIWMALSWGSFPAWIFYFAVGFYCGKHYDILLKNSESYRTKIISLPFITAILVLFMYYSDIISDNSSKRIDMIFFSISIIFLLYYIANKATKIPNLLIFISRYSFGIYFLHMIFLYLMKTYLKSISFLNWNPYITLAFLFIVSVLASIFTTYFINTFKYGKYIVGKVARKPKKEYMKTYYVRGYIREDSSI